MQKDISILAASLISDEIAMKPWLRQKDLPSIVFYEPYFLEIEYNGPGVDAVEYKTKFSSNFLYEFYYEMEGNSYEEKVKFNTWSLPTSSFRQMQSSLVTNRSLDLSDFKVGLGELVAIKYSGGIKCNIC